MSSTPPADPNPDIPRGANRLARESSPYLLLHAHNPVDWHPWGEEAIARARAEDKPIFLSVGYSTCYWCHVMERESFSDPAIAAEMNRRFVNVKVDREERPDLDEIYMLATQLLTGQGGWPNSVFLTPELEPFFAGTYFPPRDAHGRPGFPNVLESLDRAWRERRSEVEEQAAELAGAIAHHLEEAAPRPGPLPGRELAIRALDGLRRRFDAARGGFGEAPKFPTPSNLWLAHELASERPDAGMMLGATLDAMARGGLYDQLAGGFHRYATDREWRVPHFEKMLYDNGLLLELYAREHARNGNPEAARIALETAEFLAREMTAPEGAFWSAIDAETRGREGAYYVWTRAQIEQAIGAEDAGFLAPILGFDGEPFFERDEYVLHLPRPLEVVARERRTTRDELLAEIAPLRARLLETRDRRERPATDDKILADWNGTAIAALAVAGRLLARPALTEAAARAAEAVLRHLRAPDGGLLHAWRAGAGRIRAFLADYAFLVRGLLRLHEATGDGRWLDEAVRLADEQGRRLRSPQGGYFNAEARTDLLFRAKELFDGALPAANGVAALNALDLARVTGDERFGADAEATLRAFAPVVATHPDGARTMSIAFARLAALAPADAADRASVAAPPASIAPAPPAVAAGRGRRAIESASVEELGAADAGGHRPFLLRLRVAPGWHLASTLELPALSGDGAEVFGVVLPPPTEVAETPGAPSLRGYVGELVVRGQVRFDRPRAALRMDFVACGEDACWPAESLEIPLG